jgi:hypothetical protein
VAAHQAGRGDTALAMTFRSVSDSDATFTLPRTSLQQAESIWIEARHLTADLPTDLCEVGIGRRRTLLDAEKQTGASIRDVVPCRVRLTGHHVRHGES